MKKFITIALVAILALTAFIGCNNTQTQDPTDEPTVTPSAGDKWQEDIIANPGNYPQMTVEEFLACIDGKTQFTDADFPAEKVCYSIDRFDLKCYLIEGKFLFANYVNSNPSNSLCYIQYFEDGKIIASEYSIANFASFIEEHN